MSVRTMDEAVGRTDPQINSSTSYRVIEGGNISRVDLTCFERGLTLYHGRNRPRRLGLCGLRRWDVGLIVAIRGLWVMGMLELGVILRPNERVR